MKVTGKKAAGEEVGVTEKVKQIMVQSGRVQQVRVR